MPLNQIPAHWATPILRRGFWRKGLWICVFALLVVLWSLVLSFTYAYRSHLIKSSTSELAQLNSVVAQHTFALFRSVETDLKVIDRWLQNYPGKDPLNEPSFIALIDELRKLSGHLIDMRLVTASGQTHFIPDPQHQSRADVSDRGYFKAHLGDGPQTLHIGDPVLSRFSGKWLIPISWRLTKDVAGFHVVIAVVELDRLTAPHERWRMKNDGTILLIRDDGLLLSRSPFDARLMGTDFSKTPEYKKLYTMTRGSFVSTGRTTDQVARLVSFERLDGSRMMALTTRGLDEAMAPYYTIRRALLWTASALSLLVLAFAIVINRMQKSLFKAQHSLQRLALVDELTGVMNRRAFIMQMEREVARARRQNEGLAVLMIDVDHFKQVNDNHGHAVGDEVLAALPRIWSQALRANDLLGRLGGEEFCIALPNTGNADALDIARRLCTLSTQTHVSGLAPKLRISISVGLAWWQESDGDWQPVLARADAALYRAKQNGRNCVEAQDA